MFERVARPLGRPDAPDLSLVERAPEKRFGGWLVNRNPFQDLPIAVVGLNRLGLTTVALGL